ncbi:MAG TPA: hypothetical protein VM537_30075 [Anaerolineae bacterium]|nr:hypothetical protein [Anaerolineae bacterium]
MAEPRVEKRAGQTDQEILKLSYAAFEERFGFTPEDKVEQRHFANTGERLTDPRARKGMEMMDQFRKDAEGRRAAP